MQFELLRIAIALAGLLAATYYDLFNRRNVPVSITYFMIGTGFLLNLATLDLTLIGFSSLAALLVFALGYLVYRSGQIGGADVLIFASLALLFPSAPASLLKPPVPPLFEYPFVVSVFMLSGLLSIFGMAMAYIPRIVRDAAKGRVTVSLSSAVSAAALLIAFLSVLYVLSPVVPFQPAQLALVLVVLALAVSLLLFKDHISATMIEWVPISQIDDEDVISLERLDEKVVAKYGLQRVATKEELAKLRKTRLRKFPVFKGMPAFVPYMLLAIALLLVFGDPFWLLLY